MFTGIVADVASVVDVEELPEQSIRLLVSTALVSQLELGGSIAINGVCLTAETIQDDGRTVSMTAMRETTIRSNLGRLSAGDRVNAELPVSLAQPLGGHLVSGHVDAMGTVISRTVTDVWEVLTLTAPTAIAKYLVPKGSITIDGVSLTVVDVADQADGSSAFTVSLIPATLDNTTLGSLAVGAVVNLEADMLAKYVERIVQVNQAARTGLEQA